MRPAFALAAAFLFWNVGCGESPGASSIPALRDPQFGPVPPLPDWPDDPPTQAKVQLGRALFFDPRLSGSGQTSCDKCHGAATRFQDNLRKSVPDRSFPLVEPRTRRNTTSMLNIVYAPIFRWDGSQVDLVSAMVHPLMEENMNLGLDLGAAQTVLQERITQQAPGYIPLFQSAFGVDPAGQAPADVWRLTGRALAAFIRGAVSIHSPFDRWNAGDDGAMNERAVRGFEIFKGRGRCSRCHSGPLFSDFLFHNVSTSLPDANGKREDEGRFEVSGRVEDRGAFLTPTLRGAYDTQPYLHDGSALFLRDVVRHFGSAAVLADPAFDPLLDPAPSLSDGEVEDVVAFIGSLRGEPLGDEFLPPPDGLP